MPPRLAFIYHADYQPACWAFFRAHGLPCRRAVRRNHNLLVHAGAVRINRDLRRSLRFTTRADGLANYKPPTLEARMFPSCDDVAFDTG